MGDSISYTFVYSGESDADDWKRKCAISTLATCLFFLGMMMVYFLRMFRIFRVYTFYNKYLEDQIKNVKKKLKTSPSDYSKIEEQDALSVIDEEPNFEIEF